MGATLQPYLNLKNTRLNLRSGIVLDCTNISIKRNPIFMKRKPGAALVGANVYNGEDDPEIMIEGLNGTEISFGELVPNDPVETLTLNDTSATPATVFQDDFFTKFPVSGWVLGGPETSLNGDDPSTWRLPLIPNCMNPNGVEDETP